MKPRLFIGSSVESLSVAHAVQENFEYDAEVTVWPEGIFEPSKIVLQQLLAVLDGFDFAVFVFAPDDVGIIRDHAQPMTRDNVIFELGLFIAHLGSERCFFLVPRGTPDLRLPSDLLGVTPAVYDNDRQDKNIVAGMGAACNKIRRVISRMGRIANDATEHAAVTQMAAGLAEEMRWALKAWLQMQGKSAPTKKMFEELEHVFEIAMSAQENARTLGAANEILARVAALDSVSLEVARAIRARHLTREQYKMLLEHSMVGKAMHSLRQVGLVVPLVGFENGREAPVYWFPPCMSKKIIAALAIAAKSNGPVIDLVKRAFLLSDAHAGKPHKKLLQRTRALRKPK